MKDDQPQVFISYSNQDKQIACIIAKELERQDILVWFDENEINIGDSIGQKIQERISASDYIVIILSKNYINNIWLKKEFDYFASPEIAKRDITILPVLVSNYEIPFALKNYQYFDLRDNFEYGLSQLIDQLSLINLLNFYKLNGIDFENLVIELLEKLNFDLVSLNNLKDSYFDFLAKFSYIDPFEIEIEETWLGEIKFYGEKRFSLDTIRQLVNYLVDYPEPVKGLLITNSHLTSVAREWLLSFQEKHKILVRVIEGTELKRLLLHHPSLIKKYFSNQPSVLT
ncbi:MAG: TIR domain-containing protein [Crocosphaera sp.]